MKVTINDKEVNLSSLNGSPVWVDVDNELNVIAKVEGTKVDFDFTEERNLLGETLFNARKNKGYTMDRLVEISGISKTLINGYEKGHKTPNIDTLLKLCFFLEIDLFDMR